MLDTKVRALGLSLVKKETYENYSLGDMQEAFQAAIAEIVCDKNGQINMYSWEKNKHDIFELMVEMLTIIEPQKIKNTFGRFAEVKEYNDGDKPRFQLKTGSRNVKRFVTRVAAAGVYERVRLDRQYFDVDVYAHGGAVYQTLEGFLSGRESITEVFDLLLEAYEDELYDDIIVALNGIINSLPANNKAVIAGFDRKEMVKLINTVSAYGKPEILCTIEFASTLAHEPGFTPETDKTDMRNQGYIGKFMGANVVLLPQSFEDSSNTVKVVDPQFAYVIPSGANEKVIKVALEGNMKIRQMDREDWSVEIQSYRKCGVAVLHTNHIAIYQNTDLG